VWKDRPIKEDEMGVNCMGKKRNACKILIGKPEGKRSLRRPRHRWEHNITMELQKIGWEGVD
jgi:hypothetical protein